MNKKVLITGAEGFIGSHLVERLVQSGFNVRAHVLYNSFGYNGWLESIDSELKDNFEIFYGDIRDPQRIKQALNGCDIVLNLAALIAIPYSYHATKSYFDTNVYGLLNILNAANELSVDQVVHTSTSEVYGSAQYVPIDEKHPLVGQSPYSASKISADQLAVSYYRSFETPVKIIRPFNTYGPRQSARAVIPSIITQLLSDKKAISLGSLTPTRDFNYIQDTVSGYLAIIDSQLCFGEVVNIGSGFEVSIQETYEIIASLMSIEKEILSDFDRLRPQKSEVERLFCDNSKARKLLNFVPEFSGKQGFKSGLKRTIDWFSNSENTAKYNSDIYNI
jgi:NAD dependent epimerase/dehydratase